MTDTAIIPRGDVVHRFGGGDAGVVAGRTVIRIDARVIEGDARKAGVVVDVVTVGAIQGCRKVT